MTDSGGVPIALVGGSPLLRKGMRAAIAQQRDRQVVGEFGDSAEVSKAGGSIIACRLAVVVSKHRSSGAFSLTTDLVRAGISVVALIVDANQRDVARAASAGAIAIVSGEAPAEEVLSAIRDAARGRRYVSPSLLQPRASGNMFESLSGREREVFVMLAKGMSNRQIGRTLFISAKTVETHRGNIYKKPEVHCATDLVHAAYREGVIAVPMAEKSG